MREPPAPAPVEAFPLVTTVGLLMEAHAGLSGALERRLVDSGQVAGQSFEILLRLVRTPDHRLRMRDLAAQTTLTASGLTRAVDRLVHDGYVAREPCADGRRVSYAVLTADGEAAIRRALPVHIEHLREVFDGFDARDLDHLERLMRRLRDSLNPDAAAASHRPAHVA